MKTTEKEQYTTPTAELFNVTAEQVICQSGKTSDYTDGGDKDDSWF